MNNEIFTIFITDDSVNEDFLEHYEVVQWSYKNLNHPYVISVTKDDIYQLGNIGLLDIISDLNESLLGDGEDDWIIDNSIKQSILDQINLKKYSEKKIIDRLKYLLTLSIQKNKNIYFHF